MANKNIWKKWNDSDVRATVFCKSSDFQANTKFHSSLALDFCHVVRKEIQNWWIERRMSMSRKQNYVLVEWCITKFLCILGLFVIIYIYHILFQMLYTAVQIYLDIYNLWILHFKTIHIVFINRWLIYID